MESQNDPKFVKVDVNNLKKKKGVNLDNTIDIRGHKLNKNTVKRAQALEDRITEAIEMFYRNDN